MSRVYDKLHSVALDLLYVAPERFAMENFVAAMSKARLGLIAVDEAHCISEWGHDFRPDYLLLSQLPQLFPGVPIGAFTATATQKVQRDIIHKLRLRSPYTVRASFDRPNLFYQITPKEDVEDLMETVGSEKILGTVINYLDLQLAKRYGYKRYGKYYNFQD